jgi:hypothetical protein
MQIDYYLVLQMFDSHHVRILEQVAAIAAMCVQTKAEYRPLMTDVVQSLIPIANTTPAMSCTSTPLRPLHHVIYMNPHCANKT